MSRRWRALWLLTLCLPACERDERDSVEINYALPPSPVGQDYRSPPDPSCAPDQQGKFSTGGNRWQRHGTLCIDRVLLTFDAFPDPSVGYEIQSYRCPDAGRFSRFRRPPDFFERPVPEQIGLIRTALAADLREFARLCGIELDPAPFVDDRLDLFYLDFGDGWWFDRLEDGIRLTPNVTEAEPTTTP